MEPTQALKPHEHSRGEEEFSQCAYADGQCSHAAELREALHLGQHVNEKTEYQHGGHQQDGKPGAGEGFAQRSGHIAVAAVMIEHGLDKMLGKVFFATSI